MSVSCFTSTNSHLCKFLRTTGRDWRNTIYIECGDCQCAVSRSCKNLLCAFDTAGAPVIVPVHDVEYLFASPWTSPSAVPSSQKLTSVSCTKAGLTSISVTPTPAR